MEVYIGKVIRPKGLKGLILTYFYIEKLVPQIGTTLFFEKWIQNNSYRYGPYKIEDIKYYKTVKDRKLYILKLVGLNSINDAEQIKGTYIGTEVDKLPENIFVKGDLLNCKIVLVSTNKVIGKVVDIITISPNYRLILAKLFRPRYEHFIPFIKPIIHKIDIARKQIIINNVEGVLPPAAEKL